MAKKKDQTEAAEATGAAEGMVLMRGPKNTAQIGVPIGGDEVAVYKAREDSDLFDVHPDHVAACAAHGFTAVENE